VKEPGNNHQKEVRAKAGLVFTRLLDAFGKPEWKNGLDPLDQLIATILSQNTSDHNSLAAFRSLKQRFPSWDRVRDAPRAEVVAAIQSAGLANQKSARIQQILKQISTECHSLDLGFLQDRTPEEARSWLLRFKGVGPKTASIVLQFSLGKPAFPVDTHVHRVTGRLGLRPAAMSAEQTHTLMEQLFRPQEYGAAHLNLIRLGRDYCHPRKPDCPNCPLRKLCDYFRHNGSGR
jgi:endonuclease-3